MSMIEQLPNAGETRRLMTPHQGLVGINDTGVNIYDRLVGIVDRCGNFADCLRNTIGACIGATRVTYIDHEHPSGIAVRKSAVTKA